MTTQKTKKCFIITPVGAEKSDTREKAEGVIDVIKPILEKHGFDLVIPHKMPNPGSITQQILECILNNDLVIANLTELNPNVMYELAVRHASGLPIITIAEETTKLPFDITTERTIFYTNDMKGVPKLQCQMEEAIKSIDFLSHEPNNPIYRAKQNFEIREVVSKDKDAYILEQFEMLKSRMDIILKIFEKDKKIALLDDDSLYLRTIISNNRKRVRKDYLTNDFLAKVRDLGDTMFNEELDSVNNKNEDENPEHEKH